MLINIWLSLLLERGLQVAQHTELAEHDGSGVVAVERAHLPVLKMEDIDARDVELLTGSGDRSQAHGKVTLVGSVQRQLNDDDVTVEVEVVRVRGACPEMQPSRCRPHERLRRRGI